MLHEDNIKIYRLSKFEISAMIFNCHPLNSNLIKFHSTNEQK